MSKGQKIVSWVCQIIAAAILAMAMVPKFTGDSSSVDLFTTLGVEPWGRFLTAILELVAAATLIIPGLRLHAVGAAIATVIVIGALGSHAWKLGFAGDMGTTAGMAVVVLVASLVVLYIRRKELPIVGGK